MSATVSTLAARIASQPRPLAGAIALGCAGALAAGFFVQHVLGYPPCSLCILQRLAFAAALLPSLLIAVMPLRRGTVLVRAGAGPPQAGRPHMGGGANRFGGRVAILAALVLVAVVLGLGVAAYQVWTNAFPAEVARCGRGIAAYFEETPVEPLANWLLDAEGDCGKPPRFLGVVTMPQLGLVTFILLATVAIRLQYLAWSAARAAAAITPTVK